MFKKDFDPKTAIVHAGADIFLREIYSSTKEKHHKFILSGQDFSIKDSREENYQIGGPLCFGGDFLTRNIRLPEIFPGDILIVSDIGANTFSLWSRHCSRPFPKVIGYSLKSDTIRIIKEKESISSIINFWS